jgi:hypothetical protein
MNIPSCPNSLTYSVITEGDNAMSNIAVIKDYLLRAKNKMVFL